MIMIMIMNDYYNLSVITNLRNLENIQTNFIIQKHYGHFPYVKQRLNNQ